MRRRFEQARPCSSRAIRATSRSRSSRAAPRCCARSVTTPSCSARSTPASSSARWACSRGAPRSATVRAAAPVEAELIERQAFLDRVSAEPELARKLLVRMSARLRDVEDMLTRIYAQGGEVRAPATGSRRQPQRRPPDHAGGGHETAHGLHRRRPDRDRPAAVHGRPPAEEGQAPPVITPDLAIPEPAPYRLSRAHFSLIAEDGGVVARDLGSTLGTIVNNRSIGRDFPLDSVPLHQGENTIVAGGRELAVRVHGDAVVIPCPAQPRRAMAAD